MVNPTAAMLVIGDEILSGRTKDANMHFLAGELVAYGIDLSEVRIVCDKTSAIVFAVRALASNFDYVFTSGGIGPTHDDITAEAIAEAFGLSIAIREDARALLEAYYGHRSLHLNASRLRMARIPEGASLIYNPLSAAPGFVVDNVYVMAGVPSVFRAMLAQVIPTLECGRPLLSHTMRILRGEGDIADSLAEIAGSYADLSIGCYPFRQGRRFGAHVVVRGMDAKRINQAVKRIGKELK